MIDEDVLLLDFYNPEMLASSSDRLAVASHENMS